MNRPQLARILLVLIVVVGTIWFFSSVFTLRIETPPEEPVLLRPITVTELLQPLYGGLLTQERDFDGVLAWAESLKSVSHVLQSQPVPKDPAAAQVIVSAGRVCLLMQQVIDYTVQARTRIEANESGIHSRLDAAGDRKQTVQFFAANIEKQWHVNLAQLRNLTAPEWERLQKLEASCAHPVLAEKTQPQARARTAADNRLRDVQQQELARRQ